MFTLTHTQTQRYLDSDNGKRVMLFGRKCYLIINFVSICLSLILKENWIIYDDKEDISELIEMQHSIQCICKIYLIKL